MAGKKKKPVEKVEVVEKAISAEPTKAKKTTDKKDACGDCKHKPKYGSSVCKTCVIFQGDK